MTDATSQPITYATFWRRKSAYAIDIMVVLVLYALVESLFGGVAHAQSADMLQLEQSIQNLVAVGMLPPGTTIETLLAGSGGSLFGWSGILLSIVVSAAYNIGFVASSWQATPGKRLCGIRVVMCDGGPITPMLSTARHLTSGISMGLLGLGYLTMAFRKDKAALHDLMCGMRVVRTTS